MAHSIALPFLAALLAGVALFLGEKLRRCASRLHAAEQRLEAAQDEVWELKSAAAARDKAEAASEAKSRFLATVSHEFRTPLNGILGLAELLAATPLNAEQDSYLAAIRASGDALSSLINDILDFSRLEAGKLELRPAEFDLPALIEGAVELLAPRAQDKGLEICSFVDREAPRLVIGDSGRLRQVLINLVGNAVKFTESGGVALEVGSGSEGRLRFSIRDTGPGVRESQRAAIFQDFEQGDGSSSRRHEGAGLGLAISRRIVEQMGGKLWLESSGPRGSQFCFEIPLERGKFSPREIGRRLQERRVLIVGDAPFGGDYLARRLADEGAQTHVARDQAGAASMLAQKFEIVIFDCSLGEKIIGDLSALSRNFPDCQRVLQFSPLERRAFGEAMLKHFDGWLVKPVRLESVAKKLVHAAGRGNEGEARKAESPPPLLSGKHFLLAEDNDVNALLVERQLGKLGASLLRAHDGAEAVTLLESSLDGLIPRFTAVLMDLRMPRLDGLSAAKMIRAIEQARFEKPVPILALTANAFDDDREAALLAGMQGFLTKPVDLSALVSTLSELGAETVSATPAYP
ncbi:response regulator [Rhodoblastus acidophilus]|uniref:histidine kinase n=1 Tax=Rhodoblastus acidophilus TaxID=1074 RepID=A0A6N8DLT6_RHOAC|nr:ATP-binding protein [Rhodoblastus acidophilus]MCW2274272.1 signal transduction histidine kinase/DNA-binding response OmpR family regulator [Rhodoblastus acidophilus]MTV30836.1 response regulator [Rhodoblastus acidophilus]